MNKIPIERCLLARGECDACAKEWLSPPYIATKCAKYTGLNFWKLLTGFDTESLDDENSVNMETFREVEMSPSHRVHPLI